MERMHLMMLQNAMSVAKICAIRSTLGSEKTSYTRVIRFNSGWHHHTISYLRQFFMFFLSAWALKQPIQGCKGLPGTDNCRWQTEEWICFFGPGAEKNHTCKLLRHTDVALVWSRCGSLWKLVSLVGSYVLTKVPYNWEKHWVKLHRLQLFPKRSTKVHESSQCITIVYISSCSLIIIPMKNHITGGFRKLGYPKNGWFISWKIHQKNGLMTWDISTYQASCKLTCQAYQETCEARFNGWSVKYGLSMGQPGSIYHRDELGWRWQEPSFRGGTMVVHYTDPAWSTCQPWRMWDLSDMLWTASLGLLLLVQFGHPSHPFPKVAQWLVHRLKLPADAEISWGRSQTHPTKRDGKSTMIPPCGSMWIIGVSPWISIAQPAARNFDPCLGLNRNGAINQLVALNPVQK